MTHPEPVTIPSREWLENELQRFLEKWLKGIFGYEEEQMEQITVDVQERYMASNIADHIWNDAAQMAQEVTRP